MISLCRVAVAESQLEFANYAARHGGGMNICAEPHAKLSFSNQNTLYNQCTIYTSIYVHVASDE